MPHRTAILKGYQILIHYRDGSRYNTVLEDHTRVILFLDDLSITETYSVTVSPVWSQPGESVAVKVHQQGEEMTEQETLRVRIALANDRERRRLEDNQKRLRERAAYDVDQSILGFPPAGD